MFVKSLKFAQQKNINTAKQKRQRFFMAPSYFLFVSSVSFVAKSALFFFVIVTPKTEIEALFTNGKLIPETWKWFDFFPQNV